MSESYWSPEERAEVSRLLAEKTEHTPILQFFAFAHLPVPLGDVSFTFARQALFISENTPRNPEQTVALRKLLESKDAAVRARLAK